MNILLLEDDRPTAAYLVQGLEELGHHVRAHHDGDGALQDVLAHAYDVLVLDRMVPGRDGLSVLREARARGRQTPALLLTAMGRIEDRVEGLEDGADDYLVKPFAFAELAARVTALGRRSIHSESHDVMRVGGIDLDLQRREVRRDGRLIELQPREFSLLEYLMRNADRVVTRTMLLDRVWNFGFDPKTNIVESHISRLRGKLNDGGAPNMIRTVRGAGYMLMSDAA